MRILPGLEPQLRANLLGGGTADPQERPNEMPGARHHDRLRPIEIISPDLFDDDLVTIPKYPGKTNEQFTRLLTNVTLASVLRQSSGPISILDPLCGRGTVLSTAMMLGHNAAGVEVEVKAVETYAAYLRSYWRRKRVKHNLDVNPVRREGKIIGKRLEAAVIPHVLSSPNSSLRGVREAQQTVFIHSIPAAQ